MAVDLGKKGDDSLFTPGFRETPGHQWRLTDDGVEQAGTAGEWIKSEISERFDRYYVSPFVRTRETAALLGLPDAEWRVDQRLRERDWGEIGSMPRAEFKAKYSQSAFLKKIDALYWRPPSGESIADVRLRVRSFFDTLHRECEGQSVIVVTHGEFMSAARAALEYMSDEEWMFADSDRTRRSAIPTFIIIPDKIPETDSPQKYLSWVRKVCPWRDEGEAVWKTIVRRRFSNEELLQQVSGIGPILVSSVANPKETAFEFVHLPETPWTTYFEAFPVNPMSGEYKLVPVDELILTKGPENDVRVTNRLSPVERAHRFMADLVNGVPGAGKRAPIEVRSNANGTYSVVDGNATTAVAKILGWKELPVHVIEDQAPAGTSDFNDEE
ncbi:MAG: histidine phosphatase family protein [Acidobacteria bacterium]|nr:histidine phosphatase family protein [Acidobacteriota bacterium]